MRLNMRHKGSASFMSCWKNERVISKKIVGFHCLITSLVRWRIPGSIPSIWAGHFVVSFRRKRTKIRKKTKYTILDNMDEQERMELRPKYGKTISRCFPTPYVGIGQNVKLDEMESTVQLGQKSKPGNLQGKTNNLNSVGRQAANGSCIRNLMKNSQVLWDINGWGIASTYWRLSLCQVTPGPRLLFHQGVPSAWFFSTLG